MSRSATNQICVSLFVVTCSSIVNRPFVHDEALENLNDFHGTDYGVLVVA